jgi:hypothetical protein
VRYAWLVLLAIGCYEAPDYSGTRFKCDDEHACPDGQACVNGFCGGGSGSNMVDAAPPAIGVACGATTCTTGQKCCADFLNGPTCIALGASCAGIAATCDGVEDCAGNACCSDAGGSAAACGAAAMCTNQTICRENADCTTPNQPMCCMIPGTGEPWGRCLNACP